MMSPMHAGQHGGLGMMGPGHGHMDMMHGNAVGDGGGVRGGGGGNYPMTGGTQHHQQQQHYSGPHTPTMSQPQQQQQQSGQFPVVPAQTQQQQGPPQVSLSLLIEFIVQRSYHDLTVLAELLPRKTDMERKIEIFNYASRTRMLLVRLLALVKWASSASKVDKCVSIMNFCERSANIFMETADAMAKMARETLVRATLPNFHLPAAVEILTTGTYSRVPRCIRDRIVPPESISASEKRQILLKLNQIIQYRLVTSDLPRQMRNLIIENGQVTFIVKHEFEASLTLMGDGPQVPWRLLKVNILVEDNETGQGKALVHSMQVRYVEQLLQSRLIDNPEPLHDLYNTLHSLCQSLQLEVLHSQAQKLCYERLGDYIRIEEAIAGKCLTICYWRELTRRERNAQEIYRFSVQVDPHDAAEPLMVWHTPPLPDKESALLAEQAVRTDNLSLERLLVYSIFSRTKAKLRGLKDEIQKRLNMGDVETTLHGSPAVLAIPILQPCLRSEQLLITVDTHTGLYLTHVPQHEDNPITTEIQQTLNDDKSRLEQLVSQLRFWITKQRVQKTLQQLPATPYERLPLLFDLNKHPLKDLSPNRMFIRLHHQPNAILIVEFFEKKSNECEMEYRYYLLKVRSASIEDNPNDENSTAPDIPRVYFKALGMVQFNPFLVTHGTTAKIDLIDLSDRLSGKRKSSSKVEAPIKRTKYPAYFISDLCHVVAFADERMPFAELIKEFNEKGIAHSGIEMDDNGTGLSVKIVKFPIDEAISKSTVKRLLAYLLSITVRLYTRNGRFWKTEFVFHGNPVARLQNKVGANARCTLHYTHEIKSTSENITNAVASMCKEWEQMLYLFELIYRFEDYMTSDNINHISIKSYTFEEAVLEYGPNHKQEVKVVWSGSESKFKLTFGGVQEGSGMCPHTLVKEQLEDHLNTHRDLALLAKILHETYQPLRSICRLPNVPQMSVSQQKINHPVETFVVIPQSPTHVKVFFYNTYCLDVTFSSGLVLIRDGAISLFNQGKALEDLQPIQGIKAFLMKYVDETAFQRRQSQTEDDNPPSPQNVTGNDDFTSQGSGLRFPTSHTPPSNPLTPASPHTSVSSTAPSSGFLQSPPSMSMANPSPGVQHPNPSPSGFTVPSPLNPSGSVGSPFPSAQSPLAHGSPAAAARNSRATGLSPYPSPSSNAPNSSSGQNPMSRQLSRVLPQRLWAGSHPTPLSFQAFDDICKPSSLPSPGPGHVIPNVFLAPIHRFLGCLFLRRQLRMIRQEDWIQSLPSTDPSVIAFKVEGMSCKVSCFASNSCQSLHAKLEPDQSLLNHWSQDMLQILEKFFDTKVAVPPFRPHAITTFVRILQCPLEPFKDIINLMRFEILPDLVARNNLKWSCRICLTVPPAAPPIMPLGQPGLLRLKDKMLLFLQLTRANVQLPPGQEPLSVIIPLVYDISLNQTTVAQKEMNTVISVANQQLARLQRSGQLNMQRCTIFPSVQDLLYNLTLPNEGPPPHSMNQQQGAMMGGSGGGNMNYPQHPMGPRGLAPPQRMMNPNMVMQQRPQMMQQQPNQYMS